MIFFLSSPPVGFSLLLVRVHFVQQLPHRAVLQFELRLWGNALSDREKKGEADSLQGCRLEVACLPLSSCLASHRLWIWSLHIRECKSISYPLTVYCILTVLFSSIDFEVYFDPFRNVLQPALQLGLKLNIFHGKYAIGCKSSRDNASILIPVLLLQLAMLS